MFQFKRIVVPLDGSIKAEKAIQPALKLAHAVAAEVTFIRVVPTVKMATPFLNIDGPLKDAHSKQKNQAAVYLKGMKLHNLGGKVMPKTVVLSGRPADTIIQYVQENDIDLIMLSSHGGSGLGRWRYGGVAMKLLLGAPCSTLVVRATEGDKPLAFKRILIPLDGSVAGATAMEPTMDLAQKLGAEAILFNVTSPLLVAAVGSDQADKVAPQIQDQAERYLSTVQQKWSSMQPGIKMRLEKGPIAQSILKEAQEQDVDLIALSAHGASGDTRLPLGTVADKVIRGAKRAVLIVR